MSESVRKQVRQLLKESLRKQEEARRLMTGVQGNGGVLATDGEFTSEEVHEVALAQFATGKAIELLMSTLDKAMARAKRRGRRG